MLQKAGNNFSRFANTDANTSLPVFPRHKVKMRHLTGSILLLFLLVMIGCGKQNPVGAGGPPARTLTQKEIDEKHAANFLAGAKDFQNDGHPKYAINTLKELLERFPDSESAVEAKQMLAEIEKQNPDAETEANVRESGETIAVRGLLRHFPQDVKSAEAWLGHEFMVGDTPIRITEKVPRDVLINLVGENVEIEGLWNAGKKWEPPKPAEEGFQLQTPSYPEGVTVVTGAGIEASSVTKIEN